MNNETIVINAFTIGGKRIANVPISEMRIESFYQRAVTNKVKKIAKYWDYTSCQLLSVSYRDDVFYIMDGQHRYEAAKLNNITHLPCVIHTGLDRDKEALIFSKQNDNLSKLTPYDLHNARMVFGEDTAIALQEICDAYGIEVSQTSSKSKTNKLGSIVECRRIIETNGIDVLDWIFNIISKSGFGSQKNGYRTEIVYALEKVYQSHTDDSSNASKKLIKALSKISPEELLSRASNTYSGGYRNTIKLYLEDLVK